MSTFRAPWSRRGRHSLDARDADARSRWAIPAVIAGALAALTLGATTAVLLAGEGDDPPAAASDGPTGSVEPVELSATPSPSPSPTPSPTSVLTPVVKPPAATATRSSAPPTAELVNGIRSAIRRLERNHQIGAEAAQALDRQLREVTRAAAASDLRRAREVLAAVGAEVDDLHEDGNLSDAGHREIVAGLTALARALAAD